MKDKPTRLFILHFAFSVLHFAFFVFPSRPQSLTLIMKWTSGELAMSQDPLALRRIDHVRFFVGNARQSAYFYRNAFGFDIVAYAGLETRQKHEAGYVLRQGKITFVLISPLSGQHPESRRLITHGDGVQDIALEVDD